jgi:cytochrome c biogenesis factor
MELEDLFALLHPTIAVTIVFPLIGIVVNRAWLVRQRRLQIAEGQKSKVAPFVGAEHVAIGNWLSASVVGVALLGMAYPICSKMIKKDTFSQEPFRVLLVTAIFLLTVAALTFLFKSNDKLWRGVFAAFTGIGLIVLGWQPEIYRRDSSWFLSHYYYGIAATILMLFSLAIVQDIYKDKTNRWRTIHIVLNCFALLLFVGQGFTGARDLLEIPLSWQKKHIGECNFKTQTCPPHNQPDK